MFSLFTALIRAFISIALELQKTNYCSLSFLAHIQNLIGFKHFYRPTNRVLINRPISFLKQ